MRSALPLAASALALVTRARSSLPAGDDLPRGMSAATKRTSSGDGPRLGVCLHRDTAEREISRDRGAHLARPSHGLDEAPERGWLVVRTRDD